MALGVWTSCSGGAGADRSDAAEKAPAASTGPATLVRLSGGEITQDDFCRYAAVFVDPKGKITQRADDIVLALVNQYLAVDVATERGLTVDGDPVEFHLTPEERACVDGDLIPFEQLGSPIHTKNQQMFTVLNLVRASVTENVAPERADAVWLAWLAQQRQRADVQHVSEPETETAPIPSASST